MSLFVAIEGIEGAGKSTLRSHIVNLLPRDSFEIVVTREPGATEIGRAIRALLLDKENKSIDPLTELLLFNADRAQHLTEVIRPALARGAIVLCDRYIHSTIAYQGYGRGIPLDQLQQLTQFTTRGLVPDLVVLLDLSPEQGLARAKSRAEKSTGTFMLTELLSTNGENPESENQQKGSSWNRFEAQELEFHRKVREGFLTLAASEQQRFLTLDATQSPETLAAQAVEAMLRRMP